MTAFHTDGVERELFVDFIFLHGCIENFLLWICHIAIGIHEFVYHIARYDCFSWEIFHNHILDATNRLSAYTYIHVGYFVFELFFQFADDHLWETHLAIGKAGSVISGEGDTDAGTSFHNKPRLENSLQADA